MSLSNFNFQHNLISMKVKVNARLTDEIKSGDLIIFVLLLLIIISVDHYLFS